MYNPKSSKAEEFIAHEEVLASLEYGEKNKSNVEEIDRILNKAREKRYHTPGGNGAFRL